MSLTVKTILALFLVTMVAACAHEEETMEMDMGMVMEEETMQKM